MKRCTRCERRKPRDEFYARRCRDGLQSHCKLCNKEVRQEWAERNPERNRELHRASQRRQAADPERLQIKRVANREWMRAKRGTPPERYRVDTAPGLSVDAGLIRPIVHESGLTNVEIGARIGRRESTVRKALARETVTHGLALAILEAVGSSPAEIGA